MDLENLETLDGKFTYTVFHTDSYMVARFDCEEGKITVTGPFFEYDKHLKYHLTGSFIDHPRFGYQFSFIKVEKYLSEKKDEILTFLSGPAFKGIGKKTALKIYDSLGDEALSLLKNDPSVIYETGISDKQALNIIEGFNSLDDPKNEIAYQLISGGFSNSEALVIYERFKNTFEYVLKDNPFRFYLDVYGIPFNKVVEFCEKADFEDKEIKYKEAYFIHLFKEISFMSGDTYLLREDFEFRYRRDFGDDSLDEVLDRCIDDGYLIPDGDRYYLFDEYNDEVYTAEFLKKFENGLTLESEELNYALNSLSLNLGIDYDDRQIMAIRQFFDEGLSIITGGPGTGKTTVVKSLVSIFRDFYPFYNIVVAAPTGRAAKRISEICEVESKTIHSLLRWNKEDNSFAFNGENPLLYDAIIIDEFSMVDNFLFASLLKASGNIKKICLIGDPNQLPSIRQGNLLEDLLDSGLCPTVNLITNYRQNLGSEIIDLSKDIIDESFDAENYKTDVHFYDPHSNVNLLKMIDNDILNGYELDEIQVLSPMYKGVSGIDNLNRLLQDYFNPKDPKHKEYVSGNSLYREGDKILQLKNRPTDDVYNGDIGILEEINYEDRYFMVNFSDTLVFYKFEELSDISLAYCMSVHKAQGSEYRDVYLVLPSSSRNMINKKLLYTAVSRARDRLTVICEEHVFREGISRNTRKRKTGLLERLG